CWSAARIVETLISHPSLLCVTSGGRQSRAWLLEAALTIDLPGSVMEIWAAPAVPATCDIQPCLLHQGVQWYSSY
ncbi:hypothetical protein PO909_008122, partial [Leuciscus waleckii]